MYAIPWLERKIQLTTINLFTFRLKWILYLYQLRRLNFFLFFFLFLSLSAELICIHNSRFRTLTAKIGIDNKMMINFIDETVVMESSKNWKLSFLTKDRSKEKKKNLSRSSKVIIIVHGTIITIAWIIYPQILVHTCKLIFFYFKSQENAIFLLFFSFCELNMSSTEWLWQ